MLGVSLSKKKQTGFSRTIKILDTLFQEVGKPSEPHYDKFKTIAQELLNCSEILILKHKDNPVINKNYKILKKIEDGEFKQCKEGFEVEIDTKVKCYDLGDAEKYFQYLRKFKY